MSDRTPAALRAATSSVLSAARAAGLEPLEGRRLLSTVMVGGGTVGEDLLAGNPAVPSYLADAGEATTTDQDAEAVRATADGGFLVLSTNDAATGEAFYLSKFNADGSLDAGYTDSSLLSIPLPAGVSPVFDVEIVGLEIDAAGRAYVGLGGLEAEYALAGGGTDTEDAVAVLRLNADGTVDTSYGLGGVAVVAGDSDDDLTSTSGRDTDLDDLNAFAVAGDGSVFLNVDFFDFNAGLPGDADLAVIKLDASGAAVSGFGSDSFTDAYTGQSVGFAGRTSFTETIVGPSITGQSSVTPETLLVDGGRVYVVSDDRFTDFLDPSFSTVRRTDIEALDATSGQRVATFGTGGIATLPATYAQTSGVVEADDVEDAAVFGGQIFVALGVDDANNNDAFGVIRVNSDGTLDATYGDAGLAIATEDQVSNNRDIDTRFVGVDDAGRVLFGGETFPDPVAGSDVASVVRFTADGQLDAGFGVGGVFRHDLPGDAFTSDVDDLAVLTDGSIVIVGDVTRDSSEPGNTIDDDDLLVLKITRSDDSTVHFEDQVITVTGTDGAETIVFTTNSDHSVTVTVNGQDGGTYADVCFVVAWAEGGDDTVTLTGNTAALISGGAGDDTLTSGDGNDVVLGKDGDDVIDTGAGHDIAGGNAGNDHLTLGAGDDIALGGDGNDTIFGNDGRDLLKGNAGDDEIRGGAGNDWIFGHGGNDALYGDEGHDVIFGGSGDDSLTGGDGWDFLIGGPGDDTFAA